MDFKMIEDMIGDALICVNYKMTLKTEEELSPKEHYLQQHETEVECYNNFINVLDAFHTELEKNNMVGKCYSNFKHLDCLLNSDDLVECRTTERNMTCEEFMGYYCRALRCSQVINKILVDDLVQDTERQPEKYKGIGLLKVFHSEDLVRHMKEFM